MQKLKAKETITLPSQADCYSTTYELIVMNMHQSSKLSSMMARIHNIKVGEKNYKEGAHKQDHFLAP